MSEQPHPHEAYGASAGPWLDDVRRVLDLVEKYSAGFDARAGAEPSPEHSPECTWCPLCQAMRAARRSGPEVLERIAELATGLASSLREQAGREQAGREQEPDDDLREAPGSPEEADVPDPPTTVRIDITD